MTLTIDEATEAIYTSLHNDNEDIDLHIANLRAAMTATEQKEVIFAPARLSQNNREGRKTMQAYFRKRGVKVVFKG